MREKEDHGRRIRLLCTVHVCQRDRLTKQEWMMEKSAKERKSFLSRQVLKSPIIMVWLYNGRKDCWRYSEKEKRWYVKRDSSKPLLAVLNGAVQFLRIGIHLRLWTIWLWSYTDHLALYVMAEINSDPIIPPFRSFLTSVKSGKD